MLLHCEFDFRLDIQRLNKKERNEIMARMVFFMITTFLIFDCLFTASVARSNLMLKDVFNMRKRPFCNAFTGCGRKRSQDNNDLEALEAFRQIQLNRGPLAEIEPAHDDFTQLLADADLWGSIRDEILRRRFK